MPSILEELSSYWADDSQPGHPYLKSIKFTGGSLRGIRQCHLNFNFPLTVICGPNKTGKTTLLQLATVAFHPHKDTTTGNFIRRPITQQYDKRWYFIFAHFFKFSSFDTVDTRYSIEYEYTKDYHPSQYIIHRGGLTKAPGRRPPKDVEFLGISRILPAFEKRRYDIYIEQANNITQRTLNAKVTTYLNRILENRGTPYSRTTQITHTDSSADHSIIKYGNYSSFNSGSGEDALVAILDVLVSVSDYSLVAIEEIEIGIHPSCMKRLMEVILEIIKDKRLQVVITSHSPEFLRECPKQSLVMAERTGDDVRFEYNPNIEFAIKNVGGITTNNLFVVCEDDVAANFVRNCADARRCRSFISFKGYGGEDELVSKAKALKDAGFKVLIVWDGDFRSDTGQTNLAAQNDIKYAFLPGNEMPEKYILSKLSPEILASEYDLPLVDAEHLYRNMNVASDAHNIFYKISEFMGEELNKTTEKKSKEKLCEIVYKQNKTDFSDIKSMIETIFNE